MLREKWLEAVKSIERDCTMKGGKLILNNAEANTTSAHRPARSKRLQEMQSSNLLLAWMRFALLGHANKHDALGTAEVSVAVET